MTDARRVNIIALLFWLAFALALFLRLLNLGQAPLSDAESSWALQALQIARPEAAASAFGFVGQPGYIFLTGYSFALFGATDFLARFWPALAGALLVWAVYLFRQDLGWKAALIAAFGLALDPGLVAVSRQAGGPMLAVALPLLALGFWRSRQPVWAGIFAGLGLLSGPAIWPALAALAAAVWLTRLAYRRMSLSRLVSNELLDENRPANPPGWLSEARFTRTQWIQAGTAAGITFLVAGAGLLRNPQLLAAFTGSIVGYLQSWIEPSGVSPLTQVVAFLTFEALALLFAGVQVVRMITGAESRDPDSQSITFFAIVWAVLALALALLPPGRQVSDLALVLVPVWLLAGRELAHYWPEEKPHVMSYLQGALAVLLGGFFWLTLIAIQQITNPQIPWALVQAIVLAGIVLLGGLTTALVALGWSWTISRNGLAWGLTALLLVYSIGALWGAAYLRPNLPQEYWGSGPGPGQEYLFLSTLKNLSLSDTGMSHFTEVVSLVDTPSLRWALRDFPYVKFRSALSAGQTPAIVITGAEVENPELTAEYRGQDFIWWVQRGWLGSLPPEPKGWLTFRRAPLSYQSIILWARVDLFPGAE